MGNYIKRQHIIYDDDDNELVWCSEEKEYKPPSEFDLSIYTEHGYMRFCKECRILNKTRYEHSNLVKQENNKEIIDILFKKIGYDTDGDKSIHEQFVEKVLEKRGIDLTLPIKRTRSKYKHLNPPKVGTKEYFNWYNKNIRNKIK